MLNFHKKCDPNGEVRATFLKTLAVLTGPTNIREEDSLELLRLVRHFYLWFSDYEESGVIETMESVNVKLDEIIRKLDVQKRLNAIDAESFFHMLFDADNTEVENSDSDTQKNEAKSANKLMKKHTCPICGSVFESNRKDAKYCSARCKQAAYRNRKPEATL